MARKASPALESLWRQRVSRQSASGLSVAQFCTRERCAKSAFYRWKRQLESVNPPDQRSTPPSPSTFLPVTMRLVDCNVSQPAPIEADLPNGIRLRIPTANTPLACRLVRMIAAAKTTSGSSR